MIADVEVLVVGGGISGLATAWWLAQAGVSVEVWEQSDRAGGKIKTDLDEGYRTERAAAMVMNFRPEVNRLIEATGLINAMQMRPATAKRYVIHGGVLEPVPMKIPALLASPLWSLRGKLRMLAEPFIPKGGNDEETVTDFVERRFGREVLEKALEPFVGGTMAADPDFSNARMTLPRLTALEQRFGSIAAGILMHKTLRRRTAYPTQAFSFVGGMSQLAETLANTQGIRFRPGHCAEELIPGKHGWRINGRGAGVNTCRSARHVVLAAPAGSAGDLLKPLDHELGALLRGIDYASMSIVHLGYEKSGIGHPLDGAGFLVPRLENLPLNGNLWMSSLFNGRAPDGKALISSYLGGARAPQAADWSDERSAGEVAQTLAKVLNTSADPEMVRINRHQSALPLYNGHYPGRMQAVNACLRRLPGMHLEANYRGGVSIRDRIACGFAAANRIAAEIQSCGKNTAARPNTESWNPTASSHIPALRNG